MSPQRRRHRPPHPIAAVTPLAWALALALAHGNGLAQAEHGAPPPTKKITEAAPPPAPPVSPKEVGEQVRESLAAGDASKKNLTLMVNGKDKLISMPMAPAASASHKAMAGPAEAKRAAHGQPVSAAAAREAAPRVASGQYERARAIAHGMASSAEKRERTGAAHAGGEVHWDYMGDNGPQAWGQLKPEFSLCATGKRQSPINIEDSMTLLGPAEPLQLNYQPSSGSVVNNGHTIQVDVYGDNSMTVRSSTFKLLQFHFHHPSEERINHKPYAMVAHLVHRNDEGQLAVLAVLLEPGNANALVNKVWTYMPLDTGDRVRMPDGLLNMAELLPSDQRYYQFMGSLTTPPCSEGVLWMVLKQPVAISKEQLKLFDQLFPNNARPVQPVNGRAVRSAQ
jgi:carbonic anhydrase